MLSIFWKMNRRVSAVDVGEHAIKFAVIDPDRRRILGLWVKEIVELRHDALQKMESNDLDHRLKTIVDECHDILPTFGIEVSTTVAGDRVLGRYMEVAAVKGPEFEVAKGFESRKHIPFPKAEAHVGYIPVPNLGKERKKKTFFMIAVERGLTAWRSGQLQRAGLEVGQMVPRPLCMLRAFLANHKVVTRNCYLLLDVGFRWTSLLLIKDGHPYHSDDVPVGARDLMKALQTEMRCDWATADQIMRKSLQPESQRVVQSFIERLRQKVGANVDAFLSSFETPPILERAILSGGMAGTPGIDRLMTEAFGLPVSIDRFKRIEKVDNRYTSEDGPLFQMVVGAGLAQWAKPEGEEGTA